MRLVYALTIFVSALLLFIVQPMFARLALPLLGGTPAVWNTALVFYQAVLLFGYGYAHLLSSRFAPRTQVLIHMAVLLVPLLVLPIAIPAGSEPPATGSPMVWLLGLLTVVIGLPFFAISASSPLLQSWFARADQRGQNPYVLYAASNLGSMLSLLAYPLVLEPVLTLSQQTWLWSLGYGLLFVLFVACGVILWRLARPASIKTAADSAEVRPPTWRERGRWVALAAVPSSLLISVTTFISTDLAAIPLLWVVPLALYLLTFILVFSDRIRLPMPLLHAALVGLILLLSLLLFLEANNPLLLIISVHLVTFFLATLVLHGQLAAERPHPRYLTDFYLWLSFGGVIGGILNALVAPIIFTSVVEYPLTLVFVCLLLPWRTTLGEPRREWLRAIATGLAVVIGLAVWVVVINNVSFEATVNVEKTLILLPALVAAGLLWRHPWRFGLVIGALFLVDVTHPLLNRPTLFVDRGFFGINRVVVSQAENTRVLIHGTTIHGIQNLDPARSTEPLSYFSTSGPLGQLFEALNAHQPPQQVGVVGLGAGTTACYKQPGQEWVFYEIDPIVVRIAQNPQLFSFLSECNPEAEMVIGDARLSLEDTQRNFDLLILDAYSSDSIPIHLVTREALKIYLQNLAPDGVLAFHISNRHLSLEPVLHDLAADAGLEARIQRDTRPDVNQLQKTASEWVVMSRSAATLDQLQLSERWRLLQDVAGDRLWTDDYSSILTTLR